MLALQLYTVREALAANPAAALHAVAAAGYTHVELMDVEQLAALQPLCEDADLNICGSFYNWGLATGNAERIAAILPEMAPRRSFEETVDVAAAAGLTYLVFGYTLPFERETVADYQRVCERVNRAGERVRAAGIQQAYHHHSFEFAPLDEVGTRGWDVLVRELDPTLTPFEIDVFWAAVGGQDPAALLGEHAARTALVHFKDVAAGTAVEYDERAVPERAFVEVGEGTLDFGGIVAAVQDAGVAYGAVERDEGPGRMAGIGRSREALVGLGFR